MSLLTDFPHRITIQTPSLSVDGAGGSQQTWTDAYTGVACEITPSGGSVGERFGGNLLTQDIDLFLMRDVITEGCRILPTTPSGSYYLLSGGVGPCPAEGTIPTTYRWTFSRPTAST